MTDIGDLEKVVTWVPQKGKVLLLLKSLKLGKRRIYHDKCCLSHLPIGMPKMAMAEAKYIKSN